MPLLQCVQLKKVQFGKVRNRVEAMCSIGGVKEVAKSLVSIMDQYRETVKDIKDIKENDNPEWAKLALQYSREFISLSRSISLQVAIYDLKILMVATAAMAKATAGALVPEKKEATKESVSLLDDMLAMLLIKKNKISRYQYGIWISFVLCYLVASVNALKDFSVIDKRIYWRALANSINALDRLTTYGNTI